MTIMVVGIGAVQPASTYAAPQSSGDADTELNKILTDEICPVLKKIKGEKASKKYCKNYSSQSELDNAVTKICDKYGSKSPQALFASCGTYERTRDIKIPHPDPAACAANPGKIPGCSADPNAVCVGDKCDLVRKYVNPAINMLSIAFGLVAVISIIMGAIQYSASGGDPQKVTEAKKRIVMTLMAIVAYIFLFTFMQFLVPGGLFNHVT